MATSFNSSAVVGSAPLSIALGAAAFAVLAMLAVLSFRFRPLFWTLVVLFNALGVADIVTDYIHGVQFGLPELAGQTAPLKENLP